jgi:hypothetical protein
MVTGEVRPVPLRSRSALLALVLAGAALAVVTLATACAGSSPAAGVKSSRASSSPSAVRHGEQPPPAWVQDEVAWQSLDAGDPHPGECFWTLTRASRAAALAGRDTSYLKIFGRRTKAYVAVVHGHFRSPDTPTQAGGVLYLVLAPRGTYLAHGIASGRFRRVALPGMRSYTPRLPLSAGVWGHTMMAGGPFPGGPHVRAGADVAVYAGAEASGKPLQTVRSDAAGYFTLDLAPGLFTFRMTGPGEVLSTPVTVSVKGGQPVAAGVYENVP